MTNTQTVPNGTKTTKLAVSLKDMMERVAAEPKPRFIYAGIKEGSVGIVFGPSKSGKSIFCENLGMTIASGQQSFLGLPIEAKNKKVFMVSFEEHYSNRTERNVKQVKSLTNEQAKILIENFTVIDDNMPVYISSNAHWNSLKEGIVQSNAGIVILDSLTRMCEGIEDSITAQTVMRRLKALALETGTTIIIIHHTTKMYGAALSMDNIAGSRVVAQEVDFAIGLNRTIDGKHYIKDVMFRYASCDCETVRTFTIGDDCWIKVTGKTNEYKLMQPTDRRTDDTNTKHVIEAAKAYIEEGNEQVPTAHLKAALVPGLMTEPTLHSQIKKLEDEETFIKVSRGVYKLAA